MPRPGESLGKYKLVRRIGLGGMAEVWKAKVTGPGGFSKTLVVKTVLENHAQNDEFIAQFFDEARLAAMLTHPNIAQIFELGEHKGIFFIAMEYVRGKDLQQLRQEAVIRLKGLPYSLLARIGCGICEGLHYAHELMSEDGEPLNLVHRDVSPENVLISFDGVVKLVDFGIAKASINKVTTEAGLFKGKLQYAAPQRLLNLPIDRRDDIFSLGSVLYKAATGKIPMNADSEGAMIKMILDGEFPSPREVAPLIPEKLEAIILKAMEWEPDDRYQTAREFQRDLEHFIASTGQLVSTFELSQYMKKCFAEELEPGSDEISIDSEIVDDDVFSLPKINTVTNLNSPISHADVDSSTLVGHAVDDREPQPVPLTETQGSTGQLPSIVTKTRLQGLAVLSTVFLLLATGIAIGVWAPWRTAGSAVDAQAEVHSNTKTVATLPTDATNRDTGIPTQSNTLKTPEPPNQAGDAGASASSTTPLEQDGSSLTPEQSPTGSPTGTLTIRGPISCTARIGQEDLGALPLTKSLPVGEHRVSVRCRSGARRELQLTISENETTTETVRLGEGTLHILVRPWAEVYIGGRKIGITPMAPIRLIEGRYTVRLVNRDMGVSKNRHVRIRPGAQTQLRVRLR